MRLPDAILLNGSTSSGKTSIARALQAALPQPYLHVGIDTIFVWRSLPSDAEGYAFVRHRMDRCRSCLARASSASRGLGGG